MIKLVDVHKTYKLKRGEHHALKGVSLHIERGDVFGVIGQSGAGKSTLVRCINMLERPDSGQVIIDGKDISACSEKQLRELRENIGMVFQNFALFAQRSVVQNIAFPLEVHKVNKTEAKKRALELLEVVGLADKADAYPSQLSGGQQQRVAIARALATNPSIMLCDEATSALDTRTTFSILQLLKKINEERKLTMCVITHSLAVAQNICNKVAVLDNGCIVEAGDTKEVFEHPQSEITKELLNFRTLHDAQKAYAADNFAQQSASKDLSSAKGGK